MPHVAIVAPNILECLGMRQLLRDVMPMMEIDIFLDAEELKENNHALYFHFFVDFSVVLSHKNFFSVNRKKTIVLMPSVGNDIVMRDFHTLCINVSEKDFVRQLLILVQHAHGHGRNLPQRHEGQHASESILTAREAEVLVEIVKGYINKEIATHLNISLATVITHRKNIMDKLAIRSVSGLTVFAVMNGYVSISDI